MRSGRNIKNVQVNLQLLQNIVQLRVNLLLMMDDLDMPTTPHVVLVDHWPNDEISEWILNIYKDPLATRELLRRKVAKDPENVLALLILRNLYRRMTMCDLVPAPFSPRAVLLSQVLRASFVRQKEARDVLAAGADESPHHAYLLALCEKHAIGAPDGKPNMDNAARLFQFAASRDLPDAQFNLGWCYEHAAGVPQDPVRAVELYKAAVMNGDPSSLSNLGLCYKNGSGVQQNNDEAVRLFKKAYQLGIAESWCYANGRGVPKDAHEAARLYAIAADQGSPVAQSNLGWCYQTGTGVPRNYQKAAELYSMSAAQCNGVGALNLALCLHYGQGICKDFRESVRQLRLATAEKSSGASEMLYKWTHTINYDTNDASYAEYSDQDESDGDDPMPDVHSEESSDEENAVV